MRSVSLEGRRLGEHTSHSESLCILLVAQHHGHRSSLLGNLVIRMLVALYLQEMILLPSSRCSSWRNKRLDTKRTLPQEQGPKPMRLTLVTMFE